MAEINKLAAEITDIQPGIQVPSFSLAKYKYLWVDFMNGLWSENPVLKLILGMCSTLAVTTSTQNGLGMGFAGLFVLTGSNVMVSALRKVIPAKVRIPAFIVIIAGFVTLTDLMMAAYTPGLYEALGIFIPLIVANCIILARSEAFAARNPVDRSLMDGLGMGLGYLVTLTVLGTIREVFGNGTVWGVSVFGEHYIPMIVFILPAGSFIILGLLTGLFNRIMGNKKISTEVGCH
ncbi:MAG: electron transport complex subunit E [Nitrospirae bacterium]|nr:electron transport complex subunit E [Nitrospirota bacterium]MBI3352521.1 electron transport complex subunit E [Nitrospirota bacterium]